MINLEITWNWISSKEDPVDDILQGLSTEELTNTSLVGWSIMIKKKLGQKTTTRREAIEQLQRNTKFIH